MKEDEAFEGVSEKDEVFLSRWSRRKQAAMHPIAECGEEESIEKSHEPPMLTDADMPPVESLDENSDYSGFLSPKVTEVLRQQALQKLFRSTCFNVCDGLDDYAEDFTSFEKLGNVMTADLRFRLQQEAKREAEKAEAEALANEEDPSDKEGVLVEAQTGTEASQETASKAHEPTKGSDSEEIIT
ncbi:MAG: DUF3306 domain-containing protein [Candidatus Thiodiazotropha sp. (ex Myrtea spinifera)]|nr:DUF3306 domain-containing protein [Candidatus Thiodiazotropha sp. (ex Myrtea spinifera)]